MLFEFLDQLRRKPVHVRQKITFFLSLGLSLLVFVFWWNSFSVYDPARHNSSTAHAPSPARALSETLKPAGDILANTLSAVRGLNNPPNPTSDDARSPTPNGIVYPAAILKNNTQPLPSDVQNDDALPREDLRVNTTSPSQP